jgi:hypothetical protein
MNIRYCCSFIIPFGNLLFPMLTSEWLHLVLDFCTEYHNLETEIITLFWKYFVDSRREAWLNIFWEYINGKLFAVWPDNRTVQKYTSTITPSYLGKLVLYGIQSSATEYCLRTNSLPSPKSMA